MFGSWSILRKIMVNLEGSGNPPKYYPFLSLSFCLGFTSGEACGRSLLGPLFLDLKLRKKEYSPNFGLT
jgi:hypothetical protein